MLVLCMCFLNTNITNYTNIFYVYILYCAHLIVTLAIAEVRLHLGNTQIYLVFRSICTNFAPKFVNSKLS